MDRKIVGGNVIPKSMNWKLGDNLYMVNPTSQELLYVPHYFNDIHMPLPPRRVTGELVVCIHTYTVHP